MGVEVEEMPSYVASTKLGSGMASFPASKHHVPSMHAQPGSISTRWSHATAAPPAPPVFGPGRGLECSYERSTPSPHRNPTRGSSMYGLGESGFPGAYLQATKGPASFETATGNACEKAQALTDLFLSGIATETAPELFFNQTEHQQLVILTEACRLTEDCDGEAAEMCAEVLVLTSVLKALSEPFECAACAAALNQLVWHCASTKESTEILRTAGTTHVVLAAMNQHPECAAVQKEGCWAVYCLAGRMTPWKRWQEQVTAAGALPALLEALKNHPQCSEIQAYAAGAVGNLVFGNPDNLNAVLQADGLQSLMSALEQHVENESVVTFSTFWLLNTTVASDVLREEVLALGGVTALMRIFNQHQQSCPIMTNCCLIVQTLATHSSDASEQIGDQEVVGLILQAMKVHSGCKHLGTLGLSSAHLSKLHASRAFLREACGALASLLQVDANVEKLMGEEVKLLVEVVVQALSQDQQLVYFADQLLALHDVHQK